MATVTVTDQTFQADVLESPTPVLVDFWAEWCGPCKQIAPTLERLSDEYEGRLVIAKMDVDQNRAVPSALRIQSIPTMVIFSGGRPVDVVQGALPEAHLRQFLEPHLGEPAEEGNVITVKKLADGLAAGRKYTLVDLRQPGDFARSHLRHALNILPEDLPSKLPELAGHGPVVVICRTGEESRAFVEAQTEAPVHLMSLEKGLLEWEGDGHLTFSNKEEAALAASGA